MRDLIVDALAVARLARLVTTDTLPPLAAARERAVAAVTEKHGEDWADGIECPWCVSVYLGVVAVAARRFAPRVWAPLARALAFSEVAGFMAGHE